MASETSFKFSNYDCVGFDLDNTLIKYKIKALNDFVYDILSKFLIEKGYSEKYLKKPIDYDFLQKGLLLDIERGNILKISSSGKILKATHGTKFLTDVEIEKFYPNNEWIYAENFAKNPLESWEGPSAYKIRALVDYFDIIFSLVFGRLIDSIEDSKSKSPEEVFVDIIDGFIYVYFPENFEGNPAVFFKELSKNPQNYYYECSNDLKNWLKDLKKNGKILFLITGSEQEYVSKTASVILGPDWKQYFDIIITTAKKPGFFSGKRDFLSTENTPVTPDQLKRGEMYSRGNWEDLKKFLSKLIPSKKNPQYLYIGDSILQDVYAPGCLTNCDVVAICEELDAEKISMESNPDAIMLKSSSWQSFFVLNNQETIWANILKEYSKICIPDMEYVAKFPIDQIYTKKTFG